MDKELTTLSSKGQLVIPKAFRKRLGLKAGDFIGMMLIDDELIAMKKVHMPDKEIKTKIAGVDDREFSFEEILYPKKK